MPRALSWVSFAFFLLLSACAAPASPPPTPGRVPAIIPTQVSLPTVTPEPTQTPTLPPTAAVLLSHPQLIILAKDLNQPDDLLLAADGSIYLSDVGDGTILRYSRETGMQTYLSGFNEPEGMVILPDGSLIIAEQGNNRLMRYDPTARTLSVFLNLNNKTDQPGVDGIALDLHDPTSPSLIVPDSPNGTVLRVRLEDRSVTRIASGFVRPTAAWVEPDGSLLVVDEYGNSLDRIRTDGTIQKLARLPTPDDVVEDPQGNIFVNTLGDNAVHFIQAASQQAGVLIGGLGGPQGLLLDPDGNLIVTDPGNHRLIKLVIH